MISTHLSTGIFSELAIPMAVSESSQLTEAAAQGMFYAFAIVFFGAAMVLTFIAIARAPIFGVLWATSVLMIGLRLRSSTRSMAG